MASRARELVGGYRDGAGEGGCVVEHARRVMPGRGCAVEDAWRIGCLVAVVLPPIDEVMQLDREHCR